LGNEIATVRISEFFIVLLQCDNSDGAKVQKEMQTKKIWSILSARFYLQNYFRRNAGCSPQEYRQKNHASYK